MKKNIFLNNRGTVLAVVVIFIFIFTILGLISIRSVSSTFLQQIRESNMTRVFYATEWRLEWAAFQAFQSSYNRSVGTTYRGNFLQTNSDDYLDYRNSKWYIKGEPDTGVTVDNYEVPHVIVRTYIELQDSPAAADGFRPSDTPGEVRYYVITAIGEATGTDGTLYSEELKFFFAVRNERTYRQPSLTATGQTARVLIGNSGYDSVSPGGYPFVGNSSGQNDITSVPRFTHTHFFRSRR